MEKHFVTYKQALALKELGFDIPCMGKYDTKQGDEWLINIYSGHLNTQFGDKNNACIAPLKSQVFEWFREKHGIWVTFEYDDCDCVEANVCWYVGNCFRYGIGPLFLTNELGDFKTYEEAESACIDKLIEIIKKKVT